MINKSLIFKKKLLIVFFILNYDMKSIINLLSIKKTLFIMYLL